MTTVQRLTLAYAATLPFVVLLTLAAALHVAQKPRQSVEEFLAAPMPQLLREGQPKVDFVITDEAARQLAESCSIAPMLLHDGGPR